jgi:predicted negative regulator of RcsB-dependent stress response
VDEYLSERERIDQLKAWWRENGWFLLGGAALGGLALFGWNQYQAYLTRQAEDAAVLYQNLKQAVEDEKPDEASALLARLRAEQPESAYAQQGGLLVAKTFVVTAPERAAEELRLVMEHSDDPELAMIARLRLARVLAYREQHDEALALLAVEDPGEFAGRLNEVKGDIQVALGRVEEARAAYLAALIADGSELLDRSLLQMKLNDLPNGAVEPAANAESPGASAPADESAPAPDEGAQGEGE